MRLGHWDVALGRVHTDDGCAQTGHRFTQQSPATADIQNAQPVKGALAPQIAVIFRRDLRGDIIQPTWV